MKRILLPFILCLSFLSMVMAEEEKYESITLGGGCFWCIEAVYLRIEGVVSAVSGYTGGHVENPTYEQICTKTTGHIEVVKVTYDPEKITTEEILAWFWKAHDPTTKDRQGADKGPQYASAIFYETADQKAIIDESVKTAQKDFKSPIVTHILPAVTFYKAEDYHQNYYNLNENQGYCRYVIAPKLEKLKLDKKK